MEIAGKEGTEIKAGSFVQIELGFVLIVVMDVVVSLDAQPAWPLTNCSQCAKVNSEQAAKRRRGTVSRIPAKPTLIHNTSNRATSSRDQPHQGSESAACPSDCSERQLLLSNSHPSTFAIVTYPTF